MKSFYDLLLFFKTQSLYINIPISIITLIILFLPILTFFLGGDILSDLLELRSDFLPYIIIVFLASSVFSMIQFFLQRASEKKRKRILRELEALRNIYELEEGFKSQRDCLNWANQVAPLIKQVSMQNYINFAPFAQKLNAEGVSGIIAKSLINTMISNLDQTINELKINP